MTKTPTYHFFSYEAKPNPSNPEYEQIGGAFVNAWATKTIEGDPDVLIRARIEEEDWTVQRLEEHHLISREGYATNQELSQEEKDEIFELLDSADEFGLCLAFYTWDREES